MVAKPARQGCAVLLMGKTLYLLSHQPALMDSSDTAARLRTTVARDANLNLASVPEPRSTSAGTYDSTDTSFVAADFISEARKGGRSRCKDWLASSFHCTTQCNNDLRRVRCRLSAILEELTLAEAMRLTCMLELTLGTLVNQCIQTYLSFKIRLGTE